MIAAEPVGPGRPPALTLHSERDRARGAGRVEVVEGLSGFAALEREWDALLASGPCDAPFHRHLFVRAWLQAFEPPSARLRVLVARDAEGAAVGMAPFVERRRRGLVVLEAPANDHTPRVEWILGPDPAAAVDALWAHLRDTLRWDVLVIRDVARAGPTSVLLEERARADRHPAGRWASLLSPHLTLGGGPREARASSKFLANLRRRTRRLQELGALSYRRLGAPEAPDPAEAARLLDGFLELEAAGWKGRQGTAIAGDARTLAFYRGLAGAAGRAGMLALRSLELDGRPVAMHFGLFHRGVYGLLKPAYDEALAACSPGQLLFREVLAECEARGASELDFLGPDMPWKRDWEPELRPHDWLYVYRPGVTGAALHLLKHRVKPRVKPLVKEVLSWWRR